MKIILLRHGETVWNKERRIQGRTELPLSEEGAAHIAKAAKLLVEKLPPVDVILSSPLLRARQSAEIVARELGYPTEAIGTAPLFIERHFGVAEGMTYEEALAAYPDSDYPGMEDLPALYQRADAAIRYCLDSYPGQTVLVVSHGALIKSTLVNVTNGRIGYHDEDVWIENGNFCLLEQEAEGWKLTIDRETDKPKPHVMP